MHSEKEVASEIFPDGPVGLAAVLDYFAFFRNSFAKYGRIHAKQYMAALEESIGQLTVMTFAYSGSGLGEWVAYV